MRLVTMPSTAMADLVHIAASRGATYADARSVEREHEAVSVKDGAVESVTRTSDRGLGFRVIHRGAWGFAATDQTDDAAIRGLIDEAFRRSEAAASVQRRTVRLAPIPPQHGEYRTRLRRDPFSVPLAERIDHLRAVDAAAVGPNIKTRRSSVAAYRTRKRLVTSEGTDVSQEIVEAGAGLSVLAVKAGRNPASRHGHVRVGRRRRTGDADEARRQRDLRRLPDVARDRGGAWRAGRDRVRARGGLAALPDRAHGERQPRSGDDALRGSAPRCGLRAPAGGAGLVLARRQATELPLLDAIRPSDPKRSARATHARRRVPVAHARLLGTLRSRRGRLGAPRLPLVREGRASAAHARRPRRRARALPRRPDRGPRVSLLGADRLLAPAREALRDVPADEADIHIHRRRAAITRFSRSSIHQNAVSDETHATVRANVGKAVGIVTTNSLAPPDLRRALADAASLARASRPDDEWPGVADPEPIAPTPPLPEA